MKIKQSFLSIFIVIVIFGTVFATSAMGLWHTTTTRVPVKYKTEELSGQYNPADIRGSYSFGDISKLFEMPLNDLGDAFAVDDKNNYELFKCKDLETIYAQAKEEGKEVGTGTVRVFVALYKGLPIELSDTTYFPSTAKDILFKTGKLSDEQKTFVASHLVDLPK